MKSMQGIVIGVVDPKTVKVEVARSWQHPLYKKYVKRTKSYLCGVNDDLQLSVGDAVSIVSSRPLSKLKRFVVIGKGEATLA